MQNLLDVVCFSCQVSFLDGERRDAGNELDESCSVLLKELGIVLNRDNLRQVGLHPWYFE
ncbi:hypothetical protein D9M69_662430 [compost metagenome]